MFSYCGNNELTSLKGIGQQKKDALKKLDIYTITDLFLHYPSKYQDRTKKIPLSEVIKNGLTQTPTFIVTTVTVVEHQFFGTAYKKNLKVIVKDNSGVASLLCFNRNFLATTLQVGQQFHLSGFFSFSHNQICSSQFEIINCNSPNASNFFTITPIYPLAKNISNNFMCTIISEAIKRYAHLLTSNLPSSVFSEEKLIPISQAICEIHNPTTMEKKEEALYTLKFLEFYKFHKTNLIHKKNRTALKCSPLISDTSLQDQLKESLPFQLTNSQLDVIKQINIDLCKPFPMERLLQGDVGSGKTVVTIFAALLVVANKKQVAFMAPTELLARQQATVIEKLCTPLSIRVALLTGKLTANKRSLLLEELKDGNIDILVGTHALFTNDVVFKELALAIIDEQHKFGVKQRELLVQKGNNPHLLLLSATPIPRTLAQSIYAHIELSTIQTMPIGRKPITTHLATEQNQHKVYQKVIEALERGEQAYFIYPHIGEKEDANSFEQTLLVDEKQESANGETVSIKIKNATDSFKELSSGLFKKYRCKLLHSQLEDDQKALIMDLFYNKKIDILFATTIVEVGIDNPNATTMVIESAQQFGLSTLHQLRGRIGRGDKASTCFLIYNPQLSQQGKVRLRTMKESNDGFFISQVDLELRGPGEIFGLRQWGDLKLNLANPITDSKIESKVLARLEKDIL